MTDKVEIEITAKDKAGKELKKFSKDAEKHLGKVEKAAGGLSKGFLSLGTAMKAAFVAGAAAITAAVYTAQRIVRDSISAASALEEVQNKFNVVFRDQIQVAEEWADALRESYLMSRREAKEYLSSIQDLLVPMGMASDQAGKLSFEVTKLAADLGSFNNLPTAQVMGDIQSALVGNCETMKKYGVVLTAAAVEQRALNMGLASTKDELTAAHKAQAAYNIMVEDSAAAIGDVARSSGSYANQVKQYKANLEDLRVVIGTALLPTVTDVVSRMNEWIKANEAMIQQKIPEFVDRIKAAAEKAAPAIGGMAKTISEITTIGRLFETPAEELERQIRVLEEEKNKLIAQVYLVEETWAEKISNVLRKALGLDPVREVYTQRLAEVKQELASLEQRLKTLTDPAEKSAEEIKKGAEAAKEQAEGMKEAAEKAEEVAGNYSQIKITSEETATSFKERSEELEKQNKLLQEQIRLLKQAASTATEAAKPGITSHTPGMKYGGPVIPMQGGGTIPGWGGGDQYIRALEGGEEVLDKVTARYARQRGILNALREAARGGTGQQQGYHLIRFEFGGESHSLRVMEDTDVVEAFVRGLQRCEKTRGHF